MTGGRAVELVIAVVVLALLASLTVLLARANRLLTETRGLVADLCELEARRPGTSTELPAASPPAAVIETAVESVPVSGPGTALAVPEPVVPDPAISEAPTAPTLRDIATATLGPPLIRAAALGYGVRDVLAERSAAQNRRQSRDRRPLAQRTRSRSSR